MTINKVPMSKLQAELQGFTVDTGVYPWFAYKGARVTPDAYAHVMTDAEAALAELLREAITAFKTQNPKWDIADWMQRAEAAAVGGEA